MDKSRHALKRVEDFLRSSGGHPPVSSDPPKDFLRQGKSMGINGTTSRIMDNHGQGKDSSRQSLDQRFTDKDRRLPTTASHHQWTIVDRPSLDQRFSNAESLSPASTLHRRASFSVPVDCGKDRQSPVTEGLGLSAATATTGQGQTSSPVAGLQGYNGHQAPSSHSK